MFIYINYMKYVLFCTSYPTRKMLNNAKHNISKNFSLKTHKQKLLHFAVIYRR